MENREPGKVSRLLWEPFPPERLQFRLAQVIPEKGAWVFPYLEVRDIFERLNEVLGPHAWSFQWQTISDHAVKGILTLHQGPPAQESVAAAVKGIFAFPSVSTHEDVGYASREGDPEPLKSAISDAVKRCAVHIGIGAYLYALPPIWEPWERLERSQKGVFLPAGYRPLPKWWEQYRAVLSARGRGTTLSQEKTSLIVLLSKEEVLTRIAGAQSLVSLKRIYEEAAKMNFAPAEWEAITQAASERKAVLMQKEGGRA